MMVLKKTNVKNINVEKLLEEARVAISQFCFEECKAFCCRKGYLVIKEDEIDLVTQGRKKELERKRIIKKIGSTYSLNLGNPEGCPSLKDFKCVIHKKEKRPDACKKFPVFFENSAVLLSGRCLAVKQGLFYPYVSALLRAGIEVREGNSLSDTISVIEEDKK
jgi:Fe-S-cluster containining protein